MMVRLVMAREIRQRLRSKGFIAFTILLCVGIIGIGILNRVLSGDDTQQYSYGIVGTVPDGFVPALTDIARALDIELQGLQTQSLPAAEAAVDSGNLDVFLDVANGTLVSKSALPEKLETAFRSAW